MKNCGLCQGTREEYRLVQRTELVYAIIPREPMREGHMLILPQRHVKLEKVTLAELAQLRDVTVQIKDRLFNLYPSAPPYLYSVTDTPHASIPEHLHFHILPYEANLRTLLAHYSPALIREREIASLSEIEQMALTLRPRTTNKE